MNQKLDRGPATERPKQRKKPKRAPKGEKKTFWLVTFQESCVLNSGKIGWAKQTCCLSFAEKRSAEAQIAIWQREIRYSIAYPPYKDIKLHKIEVEL